MLLRRLLLCAALLTSTATAAVDPALFQDLHWRLLGPFRGGRVLAVEGVPGEPEHFYFGSVNGGVWETRDAGRTWVPIFDSQPIGSIGAIAIAPSNPKVIYVGTGEADMRSDIAQGEGVYRSDDGGKSWSFIGLRDTQQIGRIIVSPTDANLVYVAALGHPYGPNAERGVFRSRDGGKSWQKVLGRNDDTGAIDLAFEPGNPAVVYAALWQTRRTPWSVYPPSNGPGSGLFKTTDGGDHWSEIKGNGFPQKPGRIGVALSPQKPQRLYAIVDAEQGGMYRSDDAGATWARASADARIWSRGWYFGGVTVEPKNADVVYSANINLYRSDDAGKTFAPVKGAPGGDDYHQLWIDPLAPERRILGVDQGAVVSVNGGVTWSSWYNQPTAQFYHVATDKRFPYFVYGAQQDSGAAGVPSRTNTIDGITLMHFRELTAGGESDNVAPDPKDPDVIFGGRVDRMDLRTRQTQSIDPTMANPANDRRTWTLPLVFSYRDPKVLYFANQRVFRTTDAGAHWTVISPDLTRENPGVPSNLDAITAANTPQAGPRLGVVYAIGPSRMADGDLWVGTDDGNIWRSRDEGGHWTNVTPAALTGWSKVGMIETSHFDAESAWAAVDRHRLDDFKPYVYRTHDGGKSWQLASSGIEGGSFVNAVREDPMRKGLLFAGTEKGVYVSWNDGDEWQPLQMNLPVTSVRDLEIHENDLVIATHGRSFWVIDDITPLRQMGLAEGPAYLFKPAVAWRERPAGFSGTPMPKDEPMAVNPPFGAFIDYVLRGPNAGAVTLEILDEHGSLVRRYSSSDTPAAMNLAKLNTAPEWFVTPSTLSTTPGMHRFVWPLRYPAPAAFARGRGSYADGIWAPPGSYKLVLTAGGQRLEQPLVVAGDPRVVLPAAAYAEQFALARRVEQTRVAVAAALEEVNALLGKIGAAAAVRGGLGTSLETLGSRASEIAGPSVSFGVALAVPPPAPTTLRFVDSALGRLANAVDGADGAPTPDARDAYAKLDAVARSAIAAWNQLKGGELKSVNEKLGAAGQPVIAVP